MNSIKAALSELSTGERVEILEWLLERTEAELRATVTNPDEQAKVATVLQSLLSPDAQ